MQIIFCFPPPEQILFPPFFFQRTRPGFLFCLVSGDPSAPGRSRPLTWRRCFFFFFFCMGTRPSLSFFISFFLFFRKGPSLYLFSFSYSPRRTRTSFFLLEKNFFPSWTPRREDVHFFFMKELLFFQRTLPLLQEHLPRDLIFWNDRLDKFFPFAK